MSDRKKIPAELQKQIINATWKLRRQQGTALPVTKVPSPSKATAKTKANFE